MVINNASQMIVDPFQDTNDDLLRNYEEETVYVVFDYFRTVSDYIKLFICTCVIVLDLFVIYMFCRFKKLRCKPNGYILHYVICNMLHLILAPILYITIDSIYILSKHSTILLCIIIQIENTCLILCFLLAFGLGTDWLIMSFSRGLQEVGERVYNYSIPIVYFLGLVKCVAQSTFCFIELYSIRHIFSVAVYGLVFVFILLLNYLNYKYKRYPEIKTYSLIVATIIVLSWLPMYVYHGVTKLALGNENFELVLWYTVFIPEWIAYGNSIVIFIVLMKLNKPFREVFYKVFMKSANNYNNQDDVEESQVGAEGEIQVPDTIYI